MIDEWTRERVEVAVVRAAQAAWDARNAHDRLLRTMAQLGTEGGPTSAELRKVADAVPTADRAAAVQLRELVTTLADYGALDALGLGQVEQLRGIRSS